MENQNPSEPASLPSSLADDNFAMPAARKSAAAAPPSAPPTPRSAPAAPTARGAPEIEALGPRQRAAFETLIWCHSHARAAEAAGVNRRTVYNWIHHDPAFKAALAVTSRCAAEEARAQLTRAAADAAAALARAATHGNIQAALGLLKGLGLLNAKLPPSNNSQSAESQSPTKSPPENG